MPASRTMILSYASISPKTLSSALYPFSQKATPAKVNPAVALLAAYLAASALTLLLLRFLPARQGRLEEILQPNWVSYLLGVSIVGLEVGFLLVYRPASSIGLEAVLVNAVAPLILVPPAILCLRGELSWVNRVGMLVCLAGLAMPNWRR